MPNGDVTEETLADDSDLDKPDFDNEVKRNSEYEEITYWTMKPDAKYREREVHSFLEAILRAEELRR